MASKFMAYRPVVMSTHGMVTSCNHLASMAGLRTLMEGGNAVDAAITANAAINVTRPHMCGIGGDVFMLIYNAKTGELAALNGSGRSPGSATIEAVKQRGMERIPMRGIFPVTVPGAVDGWVNALERYGTWKLDRVLKPAIEYAEKGFPIYKKLQRDMNAALPVLYSHAPTANLFLKHGRVPEVGEIFVQSDLARTFKVIADQGPDAFYKGEIARKIAACSKELGGFLTEEDLARHTSNWVDPISTTYRGYEVYEFPPNTQGVALLEQLNIVENFDLVKMGHYSADHIHLLVEAKKLAFADRDHYVSDPDFVKVPVKQLTSKAFARDRANMIDFSKAAAHREAGQIDPGSDTIYLAAADAEGNIVSLISSIFAFFGSGVVVDGTGIVLHNRGALFSLDPNHANRLEPYKRPYHTLNPVMLFKNGRPFMACGTPGADGQTQTIMQLLTNFLDFGSNIQESIEAPRWRSYVGTDLRMESRVPEEIRQELGKRGHDVKVEEAWSQELSNAQAIILDQENKALWAGADPRRDAYAVGW